MMTELHAPVKNALRSTITRASVARMWTRIEARGRAGRPNRHVGLAIAAAVVLAGVVLAVARPQVPHASTATYSGPVLLMNGAVLAGVPSHPEEQRLSLNDGTRITLAPGASLEPFVNSDNAVVIKQSLGRVVYDVAPGGPRRWTIECGLAAVEVVGTSFEIERAETRVRVAVQRGTVLVRGDTVPDRVVRLAADTSIEVRAAAVPGAALPGPSASSPPEPASPGRPRIGSSSAAASSTPNARWRQLAAQGDHDKAYAELGRGGIALESRTAAVEDLFSLSDVARLSGHAEAAVDPLQRIVADHANDPRAPLAALTLGRIQLRSLARPAAAARSLEQAIALGVPSGIAEEAYALLIESLSKAGDTGGVRAAYARFVARFPESRRAETLRRWVHDP
jgi:transmembrane sensor